MICRSNLLEWLAFHHVRVVTEHFFVWLEEYFLQSLEATFGQKNNEDGRTKNKIPNTVCRTFLT